MNSQVQGLSIQCYIYCDGYVRTVDAHRKFFQRKIRTTHGIKMVCVCVCYIYAFVSMFQNKFIKFKIALVWCLVRIGSALPVHLIKVSQNIFKQVYNLHFWKYEYAQGTIMLWNPFRICYTHIMTGWIDFLFNTFNHIKHRHHHYYHYYYYILLIHYKQWRCCRWLWIFAEIEIEIKWILLLLLPGLWSIVDLKLLYRW